MDDAALAKKAKKEKKSKPKDKKEKKSRKRAEPSSPGEAYIEEPEPALTVADVKKSKKVSEWSLRLKVGCFSCFSSHAGFRARPR